MQELLKNLREGQSLLLLSYAQGSWTSLLKSGGNWDLERPGPQLLVLQTAWKTGEPVLVMDAEKDPRFQSYLPGFRSCLCLPIRGTSGLFLGALVVEDQERIQSFHHEDARSWAKALEPTRLKMAQAAEPKARSGPRPALFVLPVVALGALLWRLGSVSTPPPKSSETAGLRSRQTADSETIARSLLAALVRSDYAAVQALSSKSRSGATEFQLQAEKWKGDPQRTRSLAFRELRKVHESEEICEFALVGTGPATGLPPVTLTLVKSAEGWHWSPPWKPQPKSGGP